MKTTLQATNNYLIFFSEIHKNEEGRYEVPLLWKHKTFGMDTYETEAAARLLSNSKRLQRDPKLLRSYQETFQEYLRLGIIEKVSSSDDESLTNVVRYIPHHAVVNHDKQTTKLRIVFDGSARDKDGISLNRILDKGPNLNNDIVSILLRFRKHPVCMVADIEKAFLQISLRQCDRDAVRFLWFDEEVTDHWPTTSPSKYRFKRVVFGLSCSPFLLTATLRKHLDDVTHSRDTARIMQESLYVDDFIVSCKDTEAAENIYRESVQVMKEANMNLRKWISNDDRIQELTASTLVDQTKVLGVIWSISSDTINCRHVEKHNDITTKRQLLQAVAKVYDPFGMLSPFLITFKLVLQDTWRQGLEWDDTLPDDLLTRCNNLITHLEQIDEISIPRWLQYIETDGYELHGFGDASSRDYACVVYLRRLAADGSVTVQ